MPQSPAVRRTERGSFHATRLVVCLVLPLAFGWARAAAATESAAAVQRGFAIYKSALVRHDGARAAATVSGNSLAYYDRMRQLALSAPKDELEQLEGTERMLVLGMRHQASRDLLEAATPAELVAYAVSSGLVSDLSVATTELGPVSIQGERARAWVVVDGQPTRSVLQFVLEDAVWKFDLEFAMEASSGLIAALSEQLGVSENDVIFELLARGSGLAVGPEIWVPLRLR